MAAGQVGGANDAAQLASMQALDQREARSTMLNTALQMRKLQAQDTSNVEKLRNSINDINVETNKNRFASSTKANQTINGLL
jgi:hypothetical protein